MRLNQFLRALGPVVALAAMGAASGCSKGHTTFRFNGSEGVPLGRLDLGGEAPHEVVLLGPDTLVLATGERLAVRVEGPDAVTQNLRFALADGSLAILRDPEAPKTEGKATVHVTMPPAAKLVLAGSGRIEADGLASDAEVVVAGSGLVETPQVDARKLSVSIAGSGRYTAGGTAEELDLSIAGSGRGRLDALKAGRATVSLAGSGSAAFASDGDVDASIMGSGEVTVRGSARCKVSSVGSGRLVCERAG